MKKTVLKAITLIALIYPSIINAQETSFSPTTPATEKQSESIIKRMDKHGVFNTIEIAANIGTTGLGLEIASPMTEWTKLRVGFDCMPQFTVPMYFGLDSYVDGKITNKFDMISDIMNKLSGMNIDKEVKMESKPTMTTFRLLVDVYPFKNNRHWHFTAGFFLGGNSVGKSINAMTEMPSLLALNMYNRLYDGFTKIDDFTEYFIENPIFGDIYLDPEFAMSLGPDLKTLQEKLMRVGELGVHVGDYKDGTPYMMKPDKDGTVSAYAKVNRFRPYLGFGYGGALSADGKWQVSFDAGVQFWGGAPKVTTHDGTVLNDLINLRGKVGSYMDLMKLAVVYPSIDFRISYRF
ncbi:MAG: hypothetical protein K2N09_00310 [Muribaculaceae bacterium]|nr:hypothetical protein [Muribaculaceae bacterium]